MTKEKGTDVTKDTKDWDFKVQVKPEPTQIRTVPAPTSQKLDKMKINTPPKGDRLILDSASVPKTRTRSAMAKEMQDKSDAEDTDVFAHASLIKRGFAFIVDSFFLASLYFMVRLSAPYWMRFIQYFLSSYNLKLLIPEAMLMKAILVVVGFFCLFFFVVVPVAFFNHSLGKKIFGLKVRGEEKYTISLTEAFMRELIYKPLGILIVIGLVVPFFTEKKNALHDMISHTLVIEE